MDRRFQTLRGAGIGLAAVGRPPWGGPLASPADRAFPGSVAAARPGGDPRGPPGRRSALARGLQARRPASRRRRGASSPRTRTSPLPRGFSLRASTEPAEGRGSFSRGGPPWTTSRRSGGDTGRRLNLRHKDPLLAPVAAGLDALDAARDDLTALAAGRALPARRRASLAARLGRAAAAVNPRTALDLNRLLDAAGSTPASFDGPRRAPRRASRASGRPRRLPSSPSASSRRSGRSCA